MPKNILKDSKELKDFFETNYDPTPGRNILSLEEVLELTEGSHQEVYLKCPEDKEKESVQRSIRSWCITVRSKKFKKTPCFCIEERKCKQPLKDSEELKEFFESNYDPTTGRNILSLEEVLELTEGSGKKVYLKCPEDKEKESVQRSIQSWCGLFSSKKFEETPCFCIEERKQPLKDSDFREFFESNYDSTPGRNILSLEEVMELTEGSTTEVYLKCPKHPNENSCKMQIRYWCNPTKYKPVCCSTIWNLRKIKHFIHSLLGDQCLIDHLDTATFYIIMQRVGIFETQSKWLPFLRILPKLERNEIMAFLSNSTDNIGDQLLEMCKEKKNISNLDDILVQLRRDRQIADDRRQREYDGSSLESLIQSIDLQLNVLEKQEQIDQIGDNDIFNVIYAKYRDRLWKNIFDNEEECINELVHLQSDNEKESPAIEFIQNYFLKEYNRVKKLQRDTSNVFPWTPKLMQCLIVARLENCFELPFPQMTTTTTSSNNFEERMTRWSHGIGNWSDTGTGKSLSALMCVFHLKCKITVIFCLNSITKQWADECEKFFPGVFRVKIIDPLKKFVSENDDNSIGCLTIYILSYSKFMETNADNNMKTLVKKLGQIDLIVLDEIHVVKVRYQCNSQQSHDDEEIEDNENRRKEKKKLFTKRRRIIQTFVKSVRVNYPDVKTLGLTATPVVNNLMEAESQLSLLSGSTYCERNEQNHKKFETNSPSVDSIMMIHRQLCLYGIRSLLDSEKGPDGKTSIQIRFHPNIHRPCDDYIANFAVDATEQYIELLNRRVDTVKQLVGGMKANTIKLSALVKKCVTAVGQGYKVIVSNRSKHGEGVLHFLKQYIEKECSTRSLRVSLKSSCSEQRESVDVLITSGNVACSSKYKVIKTNFIRKWSRLEVGLVRTKAKLPEIISICREKKKNREKVLLFTNNIGGNILETLQSGLSQSIPDLRMGTFIGRDSEEQREETKRRFLLSGDDFHAIDIVIATEPMTTGIDKLQEVCFSLIINLLPMTNKAFQQLLGRLVRFGQKNPFVDVYIPLTKVKRTRTKSGGDDDDNAYEEYGSEDYLDIQRLLRKETLCDAAIDGTFPADIKTRLDEEKKDSLLLKWLGVMTDEGGPRESNQLKMNIPVEELLEEDETNDEPMKKKGKHEEEEDNLGISIRKNRDEFTEKEKQIVRERQKYTCNNRPGSLYEMEDYVCPKWANGGDGKFHDSGCDSEIDHIIAVKDGGKTVLTNAQALCRNCHGFKTFRDRSTKGKL